MVQPIDPRYLRIVKPFTWEPSQMKTPHDPVFKRIDSAFNRHGQVRFETRFSRWVRTFSDDHPVLGVLFRSALIAVAIGVFFALITVGRYVAQTLIVVGVCFFVCGVWLWLSDDWRRRRADSAQSTIG